ncbi:class I SAM-dependent methyltransferase [Nakamurella sp.]|uniref:class I SAM-dependent methyltransferase n=1 Tax=Nakamurella sp. TaxID=1869182 RepID=UPI00378408F2
MGIYRDHVLPRIHNRVLDDDEIRRIRERVCAPLHGSVVEIGFGSGLNVPHYPAAVSRVHAIEPSALARRLAAPRVAATPVPIEFDGLDGQLLPLPDGSIDCALLTLTMCSIPDQGAAARELHRVLAPGGFVAYLEHGASPDPDVARRQGRMNGLNRRLSGCRLDTDVPAVLRSAGFDLTDERTFYFESGPRWAGYLYEGIGHTSG